MIVTAAGPDSAFVVSLDFELLWGCLDAESPMDYAPNILGVWDALPRLLRLFQERSIRVTWATVGMLMCKDFQSWQEALPDTRPRYTDRSLDPYRRGDWVQEYPTLFLGRDLVQRVLDTPGQEVGSHTFSHFYTNAPGATLDTFEADLIAARRIASELGVTLKSLVFPRNQCRRDFMPAAARQGIQVWRGNPTHPLYAEGHKTPWASAGRAMRLLDTWFNLSGMHSQAPLTDTHGLVELKASMFMRPWSNRYKPLEGQKSRRIKAAMTDAAMRGGVFHLWWHPHNFGINVDENIFMLNNILQHFELLQDKFGMRSLNMGDFSQGACQ